MDMIDREVELCSIMFNISDIALKLETAGRRQRQLGRLRVVPFYCWRNWIWDGFLHAGGPKWQVQIEWLSFSKTSSWWTCSMLPDTRKSWCRHILYFLTMAKATQTSLYNHTTRFWHWSVSRLKLIASSCWWLPSSTITLLHQRPVISRAIQNSDIENEIARRNIDFHDMSWYLSYIDRSSGQ